MENKVLAVVAGREITEAELDSFLKSVPQEQQAYVSNPKFREQYLEQLIALHMFAQMGEDNHYEETEEFKTVYENAKRDILAQMAMREVLKDIVVSEEEMKEYYDTNKQQFVQGSTVKAKHILTDSEDKCAEILQMIQNEEKTFEDAAKEFSTCPSKERGGDLGEFSRGQMVKEFEDAAFDAEIGHVVGPVKTQFGYHLIKVEDKKEAITIEFDKVKETIRRALTQQKQNKAYNDKVKELKEKYLQK